MCLNGRCQMRIVLIMKRKLLVALCLLISAIASAQNPYVGKWNVVKRVIGTAVYTAPPVEAWVEFTESTFTITYGSTHYVIASGSYHLSGTTFVYDSGNLEKANVTYFDGANNMQIHIEYYEDNTDKGGGYTLVAEDATLERDGTSGGGDTPSSAVISGSCGDNLTYALDSNGKLSISGQGDMYDYDYDKQPWKDYFAQITSLSIANGVTGIGEYAFYNCTNVTTVSIPGSITSIRGGAFGNCTGLTKAEFASIEHLCSIQFSGGTSSNPLYYAKHLYINGSEVTSLVIPSTVKTITGTNFVRCQYITSITIPSSVTSIGIYAFKGCSAITSLVIPNSVTTLGSNMFEDCTNLTSITLPAGISSISGYMFSQCTNLKTITCLATSVPTANGVTFNMIDQSDITLYVPASALNAYQSANYWKDFGTILPIEGGDTPTPEPQPIDSDIYTISGNKIYCTASYVTPSPGGLSGKGVQADDFKVVLYDRNNDKMSIEQGSSSVINFGTLDSYESYTYCLKSGGVANVELQLTFNRSGTLKVGARSQNKDDYSRGIRITQNDATILDEIVSENDIVSNTKPYIYAFHTAKVEAGSATLVPVVGPIAFYVIEFIPDATKKCAKPTISYEGGKLRFYSDTPNATFHSTITDSDIKSYDTSEIDLSVAYNVSVYATADGYDDSDVATVTLCWIDYTPTSTITQSADLNAQPVLIQSFNGVLQIQGLEVGSDVSIYNVHGQKTNAATVSGHDLTIDSNVKSGNIAIVKINNKAIKVVVK